MNTYRLALNIFALCVISLAVSVVTLAQVAPQRTFVSAGTGNDANDCSRAAPCRNFDRAITVVRTGGEVVALDSGGYGPVTITKAVTLTGPTGVYIAITGQDAGSNAITVNAGATDVVVLRGLTLTGLGAEDGIDATSFGTLHIENCVISGFTNSGVWVNLSASGIVYVKDTISRNNTQGQGFAFATTTGTVRVSIDRSRAEGNVNGSGFLISQNAVATINHSIAAGNAYGIAVDNPGARATVSDSVASGNTLFGFFAGSGAVFQTRGNNTVQHNTTNTTGTITPVTGT